MIDERAFDNYKQDYFSRHRSHDWCVIHGRWYPHHDVCPVCLMVEVVERKERWKCGNCGERNEMGFRYCSKCDWHQDWGKGRWWMKGVLND